MRYRYSIFIIPFFVLTGWLSASFSPPDHCGYPLAEITAWARAEAVSLGWDGDAPEAVDRPADSTFSRSIFWGRGSFSCRLNSDRPRFNTDRSQKKHGHDSLRDLTVDGNEKNINPSGARYYFKAAFFRAEDWPRISSVGIRTDASPDDGPVAIVDRFRKFQVWLRSLSPLPEFSIALHAHEGDLVFT